MGWFSQLYVTLSLLERRGKVRLVCACVCVCSFGTVAVVAALSELCVLADVFDGEVGKLS